MPTIHELLDDAQQQCQSLTAEIAAYQSATRVNQELAKSLTTTATAIERTVKTLKVFNDTGIRRNLIILYSGVGLSILLSLVNLIVGFISR